MTSAIENRVGRFDVAEHFLIDEYDRYSVWIRQLFSMVIVVRCEHHFSKKCFTYTAMSEQFDVVQAGEKTPFYEAMVRLERGKYICWFRKRTDNGRGVAHLFGEDVTSGEVIIEEVEDSPLRRIRAKKGDTNSQQ